MIIKCFCASSLHACFPLGNLQMTQPCTSSLSFPMTTSSATSEQCMQRNTILTLSPSFYHGRKISSTAPWSCGLTLPCPPSLPPFFFLLFLSLSLSLHKMHLPLYPVLTHAHSPYNIHHFLPHYLNFSPFIIYVSVNSEQTCLGPAPVLHPPLHPNTCVTEQMLCGSVQLFLLSPMCPTVSEEGATDDLERSATHHVVLVKIAHLADEKQTPESRWVADLIRVHFWAVICMSAVHFLSQERLS